MRSAIRRRMALACVLCLFACLCPGTLAVKEEPALTFTAERGDRLEERLYALPDGTERIELSLKEVRGNGRLAGAVDDVRFLLLSDEGGSFACLQMAARHAGSASMTCRIRYTLDGKHTVLRIPVSVEVTDGLSEAAKVLLQQALKSGKAADALLRSGNATPEDWETFAAAQGEEWAKAAEEAKEYAGDHAEELAEEAEKAAEEFEKLLKKHLPELNKALESGSEDLEKAIRALQEVARDSVRSTEDTVQSPQDAAEAPENENYDHNSDTEAEQEKAASDPDGEVPEAVKDFLRAGRRLLKQALQLFQ